MPAGGHIEEGETPSRAMIREIKEELGVMVRLEDLEFACVAVRNTSAGETVAFEFILRDKDYPFKNSETEKCSELVWANMDNLPQDIIDDFKLIIAQGINTNRQYLEIGYDSPPSGIQNEEINS